MRAICPAICPLLLQPSIIEGVPTLGVSFEMKPSSCVAVHQLVLLLQQSQPRQRTGQLVGRVQYTGPDKLTDHCFQVKLCSACASAVRRYEHPPEPRVLMSSAAQSRGAGSKSVRALNASTHTSTPPTHMWRFRPRSPLCSLIGVWCSALLRDRGAQGSSGTAQRREAPSSQHLPERPIPRCDLALVPASAPLARTSTCHFRQLCTACAAMLMYNAW